MAQASKGSGIRLFEVALVAGAAVIAALVLFAVMSAIVGFIWEIVKIAVLVLVVIGVTKLVMSRRRGSHT